jgi:hypothetical protein
VNVLHRKLHYDAFGEGTHDATAAFEGLPDLDAVRQLRELVGDGFPIGLYVPERLFAKAEATPKGGEIDQGALGAVYVIAPQEWAKFRSMWRDWFFDGPDAAFEGFPFAFEDTLGFAMRNFSPDIWFIVTRGEMAGRIFLWGHDGDGDAWADDLTGWAERIHGDLEEAFGGVIRYGSEVIEGHEGEDVMPVRVIE